MNGGTFRFIEMLPVPSAPLATGDDLFRDEKKELQSLVERVESAAGKLSTLYGRPVRMERRWMSRVCDQELTYTRAEIGFIDADNVPVGRAMIYADYLCVNHPGLGKRLLLYDDVVGGSALEQVIRDFGVPVHFTGLDPGKREDHYDCGLREKILDALKSKELRGEGK
jgi:hypothetical protein